MALQPHSEPEFTVVSTTNNAGSASYSGAFFPGAAGFTIGGGDFTSNVTNNVYNLPPEQPAAFRTILLGDIKLLKEIHMNDESGVVGRRIQRTSARRMYSAKVVGGEPGPMTVAMYQGDDMEEEWRQHITKYESIRHPKVMQLYGLMSTKGLRGVVFHDEMIPFNQFQSRFQHSPLLIAYINSYCNLELREALRYCSSMDIDMDHSIWIRPATGELCVNLVRDTGAVVGFSAKVEVPRMKNVSLDDPHAESAIISAFDEVDYYNALCVLSAHFTAISVSIEILMPLGTIFRLDSPLKASRITDPLGIDTNLDIHLEHDGEVLPGAWIRFDSNRAQYPEFKLSAYTRPKVNHKFWMAQANHIFAKLETTSNFENYVVVHRIEFILKCLPNTCNTREPEGYLFVCPAEEFRLGPDSFQWPYRPAYWSLDPSGTFPLSTEDANMLGFPIIHIETYIDGDSWRDRVYDALWRFQQGKGLNPESQETAINLGYPLYKLAEEVPLTCVEFKPWVYGNRCDLKDTALCQMLGHYL
ncbi:hypothetical protein DFH08DRAFT_833295 [Mycena albidolilacea]|uniref:Uncharacterized protein n=1 Tax=Mycena albidolilacea TaxID=1033008 RepID=A0AAD7AW88_9AGAR|nr:hypothetical protein DFH08DRAFT_833295 [Mycena albidolilacea]